MNFTPTTRAEKQADYFRSCGTKKCTKCERLTVGRSQYCREHMIIAHGQWKKMVEGKEMERKERYETFAWFFNEARVLGIEAGQECSPIPMEVHSPNSGQHWTVPDGVCGFAWVKVRPGNCSFAHWLKKNEHAKSGYGGGVHIYISDFGQSLARKGACARAMAKHLRDELGVNARAFERMD